MMNLGLIVSTIFHHLPKSFINRFSLFEYRTFDTPFERSDARFIYHSSLSLMQNDLIESLEEQKAFQFIEKRKIKRFSLDVGPRHREVKIVDGKYVGVSPKLSLEDVFALSRERLEYIRKRIPDDCELGIENLNFYSTGAYDEVCSPEFYHKACKELGVSLVLDTAHAEVTDFNLGLKKGSFFKEIDLSLVNEVQLSKMDASGLEAKDTHEEPLQSEFDLLSGLFKRLDHDADVVVEYYKNPEILQNIYERLWKLKSGLG